MLPAECSSRFAPRPSTRSTRRGSARRIRPSTTRRSAQWRRHRPTTAQHPARHPPAVLTNLPHYGAGLGPAPLFRDAPRQVDHMTDGRSSRRRARGRRAQVRRDNGGGATCGEPAGGRVQSPPEDAGLSIVYHWTGGAVTRKASPPTWRASRPAASRWSTGSTSTGPGRRMRRASRRRRA